MESTSDRVLRERKLIQQLTPGPVVLTKEKKTKKEINKEHYAKIKADPEKYKCYLASQRERSKANREAIKKDPTKLERSNKLVAERMKRYRQQKKEKEAGEGSTKTAKVMTRRDVELLEKRREKDRMRKRAEREKWSHQKRRAENKKQADRYSKKKAAGVQESEPLPDEGNAERSANARYQALHRVEKHLPRNKADRQQTLDDLFKKRKSDISTPGLLTNGKLTKKVVRDLAKKNSKKEVRMTLKRVFGFSSSRSSYHLRPKVQKLVKEKQEAVKKFLQENSRILPDKRNSQREQRSVLEEPIDQLYLRFKAESSVNVSRSFFFKHRPRSVKKMKDVMFHQSLCEVCENFRLTCQALGICNAAFKKDKQMVLDMFLCPRDGNRLHQQSCIEGKCKTCNVKRKMDTLFGVDDMNKKVALKQWLPKETDSGIKRKVCVMEEATLERCIQLFLDAMKIMPKHLFTAQWQYGMFLSQTRGKLDEDELMTVMDFAENYRCTSQDEIQSAYWHYQQATVHPMVNYFICDRCKEVSVHTVVAISDDVNHDHHAVERFCEVNQNLLVSKKKFDKLTQWSDGCGAQYKSKVPFANLQNAPKKYGLKRINRHFFGSRHGKNPSDGVSANVKNKATRAVKCRRAVIQNARELFSFLRDSMTVVSDSCALHRTREFVFVAKEEIKRFDVDCLPLKGTRQVHSLKATGDSLHHRNLTCFCEGCQNNTACHNSHRICDWKPQNMFQKRPKSDRKKDRSTVIADEESEMDVLSKSTLEYLENLTEAIEEPTNSDLDIIQSVEPMEQAAQVELVDKPSKTFEALGEQIMIGGWVVASFPGKVNKVFLGTVLDIEGDEAQIKFCRQHGTTFTWPLVDDIGWMPLYSLTALGAPKMDGRERLSLETETYERYFLM